MKNQVRKILYIALIFAMVFNIVNVNALNAADDKDDKEFEMYYTSAEKIVRFKANKTVSAKVKIKNGEQEDVSYTSSDTNIATVNETGRVTFFKEGEVKITATYKPTGDMESIVLKAYNNNCEVSINGAKYKEVLTVYVGSELEIKGEKPSWDKNSKLVYKTTNKNVLSVDKDTGKVKALKKGYANIAIYVETEEENTLKIGQARIKVEGNEVIENNKVTTSKTEEKVATDISKIRSIKFAKDENGKTKNYVKDYPLSVGETYSFKITDNNGNVVSNNDLKYEIKSGDKSAFEIIDGNTVKAITGGKEATLQICLKEKTSVKASVKIGSVQEIEKIQFVKSVYTINDKSGYTFNPIITLKGGEVLDPQDENVKNSDKYQNLLKTLVLTEVDGDGQDKERTEQLVKIKNGGKEVAAKESGNCYLGYKSTTNPNVTAKTELNISLLGEKGDMVKNLFNTINTKREELGLNKLKWKDSIENITKAWIQLYKEAYDKEGNFNLALETIHSENGNDVSMLLEMDGINQCLFYSIQQLYFLNYHEIEDYINKLFDEKEKMLISENLENINIIIGEDNGRLYLGMVGYSTSKNGKKMNVIRYINSTADKYHDAFKERLQTIKHEVGEYLEIKYKYPNDMVKVLTKNAVHRLKGKYGYVSAEFINEINPRVDRSNATPINDTRWANKDGVELRTYPSDQDEYKYNAVIETVKRGTALEIIEKYPDSWCLVKYEDSYLYVYADNLNSEKI